MRKSLPIYEMNRLLENRIIDINKVNKSVRGSIFLPGLMYGNGEDDFFTLF